MKVDDASPGGGLVLVGNPDPEHVGSHFGSAGRSLGVATASCDTRRAFDGPAWARHLSWRLRGRRPPRLREFGREVLAACQTRRPAMLLCTGIAPVDAPALEEIGRLGVRRVNYLTDDPWNPAHRAPWFERALPLYDAVFSPRRGNIGDLERLGCRAVSYLPFAYAPDVHFPDPPASPEEWARHGSEVVFVGGADRDRVPYLEALGRAGLRLALYGAYWDRYRATRAHARGHADAHTVRKAVGGAKVALCLVRRANRDGSAMRTFEVPAIGACMLVDDTVEHRELFGTEGEAVLYFRGPGEMLDKARWLLEREDRRRDLAEAAHRIVTEGAHTYRDRLRAMLVPAVAPFRSAGSPAP